MGSERKRPAPPTSSQTLAAQKSAVREMVLFEPRTYFLRFLVRRGSISGTESQNFWRKNFHFYWKMDGRRTALLRAVPPDSTTESPLANNKGRVLFI